MRRRRQDVIDFQLNCDVRIKWHKYYNCVHAQSNTSNRTETELNGGLNGCKFANEEKNTPLSWIPKSPIKRGLGEIATLRLTGGGIHDLSRRGIIL